MVKLAWPTWRHIRSMTDAAEYYTIIYGHFNAEIGQDITEISIRKQFIPNGQLFLYNWNRDGGLEPAHMEEREILPIRKKF